VNKLVRVLTWNIGGGYVRNEGTGDYDRYDPKYFIEEVKKHRPDIVCLQEMQDVFYEQVRLFKEELSYFATATSISPSHFDSRSQLALGIFSKWQLSLSHYQKLPNPKISAVDDDGRFIVSFDNGFLNAQIEEFDIQVVCGHCLPFHRFHRDLMEETFADIRAAIESEIHRCMEKKTIVCADFNYPMLSTVIPSVLPRFARNCLPDCATTPVSARLDYILASNDFEIVDSYVDSHVSSDHFPGVVTLSLRDL
jgi:endonuclease/exonuclease/phosphatase family metal-dependent hydrolase